MKSNIIGQLLIGVCLISLPVTGLYAKAGCCSHHGGVAGCNSATNHQLCKDGTSSTTCACDGSTTKPMKTVKPASTTVKTKTVTTPAAATSTAIPAAATTTTSTTTTKPAEKMKTAGCCSGHKGVGKCNKSTGFRMCKDGTQSTTCKCS